MASNIYALPGNKITVAGRRDWLRAMTAGTYLFGPAHRRLIRAARTDDRHELHHSEQRWTRETALALGLNIDASGIDHIDPNQPYVVLPLHEGFADLLAIRRLPIPMVYATTEELFDWDYLGPYLHATGQPCVSRTNGPQAYRTLLRSGNAAAAHGESLVVFPQGTVLGIEIAFTGGAFHTADRLGLPILPVVLTGAATVWDHPFSTLLNFGKTIHMEVLAPIPVGQAADAASDVEDEMKERALAATPGPRRYDPERDGWWDDYRFEIDDRFPDLKRRVQWHRDEVPPSAISHQQASPTDDIPSSVLLTPTRDR